MSDAAPASKPRRRRRLARFVLRSLAVLVLLLTFAVAAGSRYQGLPIAAPGWVQTRIEARIAQMLPQARVDFGDMSFVIGEGWRPKVRLRDVQIRTDAGAEIIHFSDFKATFATRPLLRGQIKPKALAVSGVFATLRRGPEGRVSVRGGFGQGTAPAREAATLPQLIEQLDGALESPALSALRQVDLRALTLRYEDARVGRAWTVDGGRMRLSRDGADLALSADLAVLSGGTGVATLAANYTSRIGQTAAQFGLQFDGVAAPDIAAQGPAFAWLEVLRAPISGAVRSGVLDNGRFAPLNATLQIGAGAVQPNDSTRPVPFDGARSYFSYDPARRLLQFDELSVQSKWITGAASGSAVLTTKGAQGPLSELVAQIRLSDLRFNPADLYPQAMQIAGADADFRLQLDPFRITLGQLQLRDQDQTLRMTGNLRADPEGWQLALDGQMDGLQPARLLALWPERLKPKTRKWLDENLLAGQLRNLDLAFRAAPDGDRQTYLDFDFADARVRFLKTMPPVTEGQGHFSLMDNRMVVSVDQGQVTPQTGGAIDVAGSAFIIPDVRVKGGAPAVVRLRTRSTIPAALSILNEAPLSVMDKAGLPVTLAEGTAALEGIIAVPLKKGTKLSAVRYHFDGTLSGVRSAVLVKDRLLEAEALALAVDQDGLSISGPGRIDGVAFDGSWTQPIGKGVKTSALRGEITLDEQSLAAFGVALPKGMVGGAGRGQVQLDFEKGVPPKLSLRSDLAGLRLALPELSWSKAASQRGQLRLDGVLSTPPRFSTLEIAGNGLRAAGEIRLTDAGRLERLRFEEVALNDWLKVPVDLIGQGAGAPLAIAVRGGSLDLRRAAFGPASGGGGPAPPLQVSLARLQISDGIALTDLAGQFSTGGGLDGSFKARLNGGAAVAGRVVPQNGRSAVRLTAQDAGGVLRSTGILKQVLGGDLELTLVPVGSGGAFDGALTMRGVRVKNAPGIAALLNAISLVGLINELNGDGIYFDKVEGKFRLTPKSLTLTEGSAVGASMGLSMDGIYALESGLLSMQGTITPVYMLNGIGSLLTRKGEGIIGFHYMLTGQAQDPKVSVNPLSALAPGILREVFRAPSPKPPPIEGEGRSLLDPDAEATQKPVVPGYEGR